MNVVTMPISLVVLAIVSTLGDFSKSVPAQLEITLESRSILVGESTSLAIRLLNAGETRLWVNTKLGLNSEFADPEFRALWLVVRGPDGKSLPFDCKIKGRLTNYDDYKILEPGKHVEVIAKLYCFNLGPPGRYTILAKYRDGNSAPPSAPANTVHLTQELESAPVYLTVKPRLSGSTRRKIR